MTAPATANLVGVNQSELKDINIFQIIKKKVKL